jgi:hypothetical protein
VRTRPARGRLARELERGPLLRELDGVAGAVRGELGLECGDLRFEGAEAREVRRAGVLGRSAAACLREAGEAARRTESGRASRAAAVAARTSASCAEVEACTACAAASRFWTWARRIYRR